MRILPFITAVFLSLISSSSIASEREKFFERIKEMCAETSSIGEVVRYEGSVGAGGTLKMVGIDAEGKASKEQWKNIEQKYGEYISVPTVCKREMIILLMPLFDFSKPIKSCESIEEKYTFNFMHDHHNTFSSNSKKFSQNFIALPNMKITSAKFNKKSVHQENNATDITIAISSDKSSVRISTILIAGPIYDRTRGWLRGQIVTTQELREC